jgi:hypothetical protein
MSDPAQLILPRTIVEVGFSQRRKMLWRLAPSYINDFHINCVVLIELPYRKRNKSIGYMASISMWRAQTVEYYSMDIRHNSKAFRFGSLKLYLNDLLPSSVLPKGSSSAIIEIPVARLARLLLIAKNRMSTFELLRKWPVHTPIDVSQLNQVVDWEDSSRAIERYEPTPSAWYQKIFKW